MSGIASAGTSGLIQSARTVTYCPSSTHSTAVVSLPVAFASALGCESLNDLPLLTEHDLKEVGMKAAPRRRLLHAAAALARPRVFACGERADEGQGVRVLIMAGGECE